MRIAVLAWGSLCWQPANRHGTLLLAPGASWQSDGPSLPVEFCRISSDGRLTLVIDDDHGIDTAVLWAESAFDDMEAARSNLAERETGAPVAAIHRITDTGGRLGNGSETVFHRVHTWLREQPTLDAAIWTGLSRGDRWRVGFSVDEAMRHVSSLGGEARARAIEYLERAPDHIVTPVRSAARERGLIDLGHPRPGEQETRR